MAMAITLLALLPWSPQGPFDARTYEPLSGTTLSYPGRGALVEPAASLGHALAGAPDPRTAAISTALWALLGGAIWGALEARKRRRRVVPPAMARGLLVLLAFLAYAALYLLVPFPGWRLEAAEPDTIVTDLQVHTHHSYDGLYTPRAALALLHARGVEVAGITEHRNPAGALMVRKAGRADDKLPAVLPGMELGAPEGQVLGLGIRGRDDLPRRLRSYPEVSRFGRDLHRRHGGVVLALGWLLDPEDVRRLAAAGVDGFEIANLGHPGVPSDTRRAILREARRRDLALVADSDWHGWTGAWRTWTLIRPESPGARPLREQVLRALRAPEPDRVIPVVAGYLGPPSWARAALAPVCELTRYAGALSPERVLGWWLWMLLALPAARGLRILGHAPGPVLTASGLVAVGLALIGAAGPLALFPAPQAVSPEFHRRVGGAGIGLGVLAIVAGAAALRRLPRPATR
ncbi:PHP domain-containing protein [Thiohalorhabdus methylotrophus]